MLKGIKVKLIKKAKVGLDEFNEPIFSNVEIEVDDVLVAPTSSDEVVNVQNLYGKKAIYTLAIPKGDQNTWEDTEVVFFGKRWRTFGMAIEGIDANIPLRWNKKVTVESIES